MNMKFERQQFKTDADYDNFSALIKGYFKRGGFHVQVNIIDRKTLVEAQEKPKDHMDLMVRVAGYSAFFVDLPNGIQNEIISRTSERL